MKLEVGKFYRTRHGIKMGPAKNWNGLPDIWECDVVDQKKQEELGYKTVIYNTNGNYYDNEKDSPHCLVEEWTDSVNPEDAIPIDKVTFRHLQRGVERMWDTYRI